ncbi:hypothetical protein CDL15_Pgr007416 [Punica granatum]|uniref:Oligopeptide transporter 1-like n=1 Tax=Punica granatum TaxID=22663 RepID=A0A218X9D4_PUNGR|nr:hypothetical protein CDL15_Pgr007416 [Punica granatum]
MNYERKTADSSLQSSTTIHGDEENDSPIEEVRLTVPPTDDPTQPALTFRTWVLGLASCVLLSFVNQFFNYRQNPLTLSSAVAQIGVLPIGKLMAATLPSKTIKVPLTGWSFSLNPGPFTLKEHVLITIFASSGAGGVYAVHIITSVKAFYHKDLHIIAAFLLSQTTQMMGYGWAGLFRKYLVESPYMWWPSNLVLVSVFRALHDDEKRPRRGTTRFHFFLIVFISSFVYYIVPGFLFPSIMNISILCLIWKDSITVHQIGSGLKGMGIGAFTFDWNTVAAFLGSPLATPAFAIINVLVGFVIMVYVVLPIFYWGNIYNAKKFPIISQNVFDSEGKPYNISRILNSKTFDINLDEYNNYSKLYLSIFFAFTYGLNFASLTATISHVALFHGKTIWRNMIKAKEGMQNNFEDVHTRLMQKNYKPVPQWWFHIILILVVGLAIFACEGFDKQLQLPWWGVLLACLLAFTFTLPVGIIQAMTNNQVGLNVITELVIGYFYPGKPLANVAFKTYGYISMSQALSFLSDFKLGHYMKIPPRSMFVAQLVGTIVASTVYFSTAWWLLNSIENICNPDLLPEGSPWTCPSDNVFYNASIIWGVVGPRRMFADLGFYPELYWFFLIGVLCPLFSWLLRKLFPNTKWIEYINTPVILSATSLMPPARSINYTSWVIVGLFFNLYVYRRYKGWWARHNYILSAGLDAGIAFLGVALFFTLQTKDIYGPEWWGLDSSDHCSLAICPTAPGVVARGCPVL